MSQLSGNKLPGLYQSADKASIDAQSTYFLGLRCYLILLVFAALVSFIWPSNILGAISSAFLFLVTLGILIFLRVQRPDDQWYNGRAVAESVKTRSWRWCMRSEPYGDAENGEVVAKQFINDLKAILKQNRSLSSVLQSDAGWFWVSVILHSIAIALLIYRVKDPEFSLPVEVIATAAGAVLTWLQAKKHNELNSSYALTAHEVMLIKGEALSVKTESDLSEFVFNSETAFSREHTQWAARKSE